MSVKSLVLTLTAVLGFSVNASAVIVQTTNDSLDQMTIQGTSKDLVFTQKVPGQSEAVLISEVIRLGAPTQDILFEAIQRDSAWHIKVWVKMGGNVNQPIMGKRPLSWAIAYNKPNAITCLIELGAQL